MNLTLFMVKENVLTFSGVFKGVVCHQKCLDVKFVGLKAFQLSANILSILAFFGGFTIAKFLSLPFEILDCYSLLYKCSAMNQHFCYITFILCLFSYLKEYKIYKYKKVAYCLPSYVER